MENSLLNLCHFIFIGHHRGFVFKSPIACQYYTDPLLVIVLTETNLDGEVCANYMVCLSFVSKGLCTGWVFKEFSRVDQCQGRFSAQL